MHKSACLLALAALLVACSPSSGPAADLQGTGASPNTGRVLVTMTADEPAILTPHRALRGAGAQLRGFVNEELTYSQRQGARPLPMLAERLPEFGTDSWRVFPDGRMETIYVLRPGLTWHDGAPLTAEDFVFSFRIFQSPEFGVAGEFPTVLWEEIVARDAQTLVIRWKSSYPFADEMTDVGTPLPRHRLDVAFDQSPSAQAFMAIPFFTTDDYVGAGPYRLDRWERGAFMEMSAFGGYGLGRPKIDRLNILFVPNPNTALANVLAGEVHMVALSGTLGIEQATVLRDQWVSAGKGTVLLIPASLRHVQIQLKEEYTSPREILDVRVRRGFAAAINKQDLVDGLLAGQGQPAEAMVPPTVEYYAAVERAIQKHPFDPNRAQQLLTEAGLVRGSDGAYANASGERFSVEHRSTPGFDREGAILADGWRKVGVDVRERTLSPAEDADRVLRSTFPAFGTANSSLDEIGLYRRNASSYIAGPANNWNNQNRGGYSSPEYDRLYDVLNSSLIRQERFDAVASMERILSTDLPYFNLYYSMVVRNWSSDLVVPSSFADGGALNLHELRWR
jgi:peptide/nickel transport system substrate-binding protein